MNKKYQVFAVSGVRSRQASPSLDDRVLAQKYADMRNAEYPSEYWKYVVREV